MLQFLVSRMLGAAPVMIGVVCVVFLLIRLVPGDPVDVPLGGAVITETLFSWPGVGQLTLKAVQHRML